HSAPYSLSSTYPVLAYADLTLNLKNPAGTTVATSRSSSGSTSLSYHAPSAGGYSVQVVNNSTDVGVPSLTATSRTPRTHFANVKVQLKDNSGAVVAEDTTSARPKTVSATVSTGRYTWVTTALTGSGTATLTGTYPSRPLNQIIGYNANDHAISIDDGTTKTDETLSPGGRVLRRKVSDSATGEVQEDTIFGYDGAGDSPAYSRPASGGTITTFLRGASGQLVTYAGTTASYPISNGHGDVVGVTDGNGAFTTNPTTDEFGVASTTVQYGWLGDHQRMATGGNLGLIRMGVRLYDPSLARFLQVDPVEGGSCNDYDYVCGDPINKLDLDGQVCWSCPAKWVSNQIFKKANKHLVRRAGRLGLHWSNHQQRMEWSKSHGWHYNHPDGAGNNLHDSVWKGARDAYGRYLTNLGGYAARGGRAVARGVGRAAGGLGKTPLIPLCTYELCAPRQRDQQWA
ncbi:MAG: RHS repeat-associated core domain-containing protein, partial [Anaerolineales bacterium]